MPFHARSKTVKAHPEPKSEIIQDAEAECKKEAQMSPIEGLAEALPLKSLIPLR